MNYFTLRNIKNFNDTNISKSLKYFINNVYYSIDNLYIKRLLKYISDKDIKKLEDEYNIVLHGDMFNYYPDGLIEYPKEFLEKFAILVIKRKIRVKIVCNYINDYDLDRCAYSDLCDIIDELFIKNPEYNKRNINILFRSILREYWEDLGFQTYEDYKESFKNIINNSNYRYFNKY